MCHSFVDAACLVDRDADMCVFMDIQRILTAEHDGHKGPQLSTGAVAGIVVAGDLCCTSACTHKQSSTTQPLYHHSRGRLHTLQQLMPTHRSDSASMRSLLRHSFGGLGHTRVHVLHDRVAAAVSSLIVETPHRMLVQPSLLCGSGVLCLLQFWCACWWQVHAAACCGTGSTSSSSSSTNKAAARPGLPSPA